MYCVTQIAIILCNTDCHNILILNNVCHLLIIAALWNRAAIIFLSCGFFYLSSSFFSSAILSCHRLDVYHASTHGVAPVQISHAGLKHAARGSLEMQDAKNRQIFVICAPSHNFVGLYLRN